jgi:MFS family permease
MDTCAKKILIFTTVFFWFSMYTYVPTLAPYAQSLGASYDTVGMILGSYGLTQLLLRIPIGIFSDAWGARKLFVISGVVLASISSFGMWLVPSVGSLLLFRGLAGIAASTWVDYTVLYASYYPSHEASKALGFINAVNSFGQVIAMLAGGYFAQHMGAASSFLLGAVAGVMGIILSLFVRDEHATPKPINTKAMFEMLHNNNLIRLSALGIVLQVVTFVTVFGFLPLAAQKLGASNLELGILTTTTMVPSIISSAMSGSYFSKHFGERSTLVAGLLITSLSCILIPFIGDLSLLYISQGIGGFARGLVIPLLMGLSIKMFPPDKRSTAMGVFQAIYGLGMFGGPVLAGILSNAYSLATGFWVTGIIGLVGAGLAGWNKYLSFKQEPSVNA